MKQDAVICTVITSGQIVITKPSGYLTDASCKLLSIGIGRDVRKFKTFLFNFRTTTGIDDNALIRLCAVVQRLKDRDCTIAVCTANGTVLPKIQKALAKHVVFFDNQPAALKAFS